MRLSEPPQNRRHHFPNDIVRDSDAYLTGEIEFSHLIDDFIIERDQFMSSDHQLLAIASETCRIRPSLKQPLLK